MKCLDPRREWSRAISFDHRTRTKNCGREGQCERTITADGVVRSPQHGIASREAGDPAAWCCRTGDCYQAVRSLEASGDGVILHRFQAERRGKKSRISAEL